MTKFPLEPEDEEEFVDASIAGNSYIEGKSVRVLLTRLANE
jgi:hypothetical protein